MEQNIQQELDDSINLFFWHPNAGRDKYCEQYQVINPDRYNKEQQRIRYPRLLILREDLFFTLWKSYDIQKPNPTHPYYGIPHFASILIMRAAVEMLVKSLFASNFDHPTAKEFNDFFEKYFSVDTQAAYVLYLLRNSLAHDGYSLSTYDNGKKYYFDFTFTTFEGIIKDESWKKELYDSEKYIINPNILHEKFENMISWLHNDILDQNGSKLRERYKDYKL